MRRSVVAGILALGVASGAAAPVLAWGDLGHEATALIAYKHLTPAARAKLDKLLASDPDTLTPPDFASRATWADKYRSGHRETAAWHFVDIEIDKPDLAAACFNYPAPAAGQPASQGPAQDCVVDKIEEFSGELADPGTAPAERLLALKFLIHFVGDLHQPLHASDDHDRGGNCVKLDPSPDGDVTNLHAFWDATVVRAQGGSAQVIAAKLDARITPSEIRLWSVGGPRDWAMESYGMAKADAYRLPSRPTCEGGGPISLSPEYQAMATKDAALRLAQAGIRMAVVLNRALS
jgi:S1/P1 Nuclease